MQHLGPAERETVIAAHIACSVDAQQEVLGEGYASGPARGARVGADHQVRTLLAEPPGRRYAAAHPQRAREVGGTR